jgi:hypothetical protein
MKEIADWVVVGCDKRVRDFNAVMPGLVPVGEDTAVLGVQNVQVDVVLEDLVSVRNNYGREQVCYAAEYLHFATRGPVRRA